MPWQRQAMVIAAQPERSRRDVLRNLIARLQVELERTSDPADREHIEEQIRRFQEELREIPE